MTSLPLSPNADRLRNNVESLGQIGRQPGGGITRTVFSPAYLEAVKWLADRMAEAGLEVTVDPASNVVGRLAGSQPGGYIGVGSHIDTVPNGGMFDGALGVLTGLEVVHTLRESGLPLRYPLEVVAFADEEGSRFGVGLLGSRSFAGRIDLDLYRTLKDREGKGVPAIMAEAGFDLERLPDARRDLSRFQAFLEIHIEQGAVLEEAGCPIGVVTAIAGSRRFRMHLKGEVNHGGTTPMHARRDASWGAAEVVLAVRDQVLAAGGCQVGTTGFLSVAPGIANIVPGEATLIFEVRDVDGGALNATLEAILGRARGICHRYGLDLEAGPISQRPPIPMDEALREAIRRACTQLGVTHRPIASMGGHDCMVFHPEVPIAMIFVPSHRGYSHSPKEWTEWEHVATGATVLLQTVLNLQQG